MRERVVQRHVTFLAWLIAAGVETVRAYATQEVAAVAGLPFESPVRQYLRRFC